MVWLFLSFLFPKAVMALDPNIHWKILHTPHFEIIYDAKQKNLAWEYALQAERSYQILTPYFSTSPPKTVLYIDDSTDISNGFATGIPRSTIGLYPVLPERNTYISHYGNWAEELVLHEYTHILTFEPAYGVWGILRFLFGTITRPNALTPRWYLEGYAIQTESQFTQFGRLKSPKTHNFIRALVEDQKWGTESLADINEISTPIYPYGTRPYFYGGLLMNHLEYFNTLHGLNRINDDYGYRIPYALNSPIKKHLGQDLQTLLNDMYTRRETVAKNQIEKIKTRPVSQPEQVTNPKHHFASSPTISPNQLLLAYIITPPLEENQILLKRRNTTQESFQDKKPEVLFSQKEIKRLAWSQDSQTLLFDAIETYKHHYSYYDLYEYNLSTRKIEQLTFGARAHSPTFSADDSEILFVQNIPGNTQLARLKRKTKEIDILYTPPLQHRITNPTLVKKHTLIYGERNTQGKESLNKLDLKTQKKTIILKKYAPSYPLRSIDGRLLFISEHTGVSNLYLSNTKLTSAIALTNTTTEIFDGTIDTATQKLYVSHLRSKGLQLETLSQNTQFPPKIDLQEGEQWKKPKDISVDTSGFSETEYNGLSYLFPKFWIPGVLLLDRGVYFDVSLQGSDPLVHHFYLLNLGYDTLTKRPSYTATYTNKQTPIDLSLSYSDRHSYLYGSKLIHRNKTVALDSQFFLPGLSSNWSASASLLYTHSEVSDIVNVKLGAPSIGITYNKPAKKSSVFSPLSGGEFSLSYAHYLKELGDMTFGEINASGEMYISPNWFPKDTVMRMKLNSTWSPDNRKIFSNTTSAGGDVAFALGKDTFRVRGYAPGEFIGYSVAVWSEEFRFPLWSIYKGYGSFPLFAKYLWGTIFMDTVTLDGRAYNSVDEEFESVKLGRFFTGVGAELNLDMTLSYHAPVTLYLGLHYGLSVEHYGGFHWTAGLVLPVF